MMAECYGITKDPKTGNYNMVINYLRDGNLRTYLKNNKHKLNVRDKVRIFYNILDSLDDVHCKDFIHCDLHSGNILMERSGACYITDFGLCGHISGKSPDEIYGVVPYIAPELFKRQKNTKASDIYSVGMLMWEIFSGYPPFDDRAHDMDLIQDICDGHRPPILPNMPVEYGKMMQKCWNDDPAKRPTIVDMIKYGKEEMKRVYDDPTANTTYENNSLLSTTHWMHPRAYHTSRALNSIIPSSLNRTYILLQYDLEISEMFEELVAMINNKQ